MSKPLAYYNEIDPAAVAVLNHLIGEGVIAPGIVDSRSIKEVMPDDVKGFCQVHLFAGGGLWSIAARLAGWPDDRPFWSASCPCQPFSAAGKGAGIDDPRHLWPDVYRLARSVRPLVLMGEQVAGAAGYDWFDGVRADMAREAYASRSIDFPACAVDAPHQRNRQYWAALAYDEGRQCWAGLRENDAIKDGDFPANGDGDCGSIREGVTLGDALGPGLEGLSGHGDGIGGSEPDRSASPANGGERGSLDDGDGRGFPLGSLSHVGGGKMRDAYRPNGTYWSGAQWIECHDGKARRAEPSIRFLVNGLPGRVDLWRIGGNAIVPQAAKEAIAALIDVYGLPPAWGTGHE